MLPRDNDSTPNPAAAAPDGQGLKFPAWPAVVLLVAAAAIRIVAAHNDLWLDEIWSLTNVRATSSPLDIVTKIHLDNNHYLNSLWMYPFRDRGNWPGYRIPAIVAGVGCVLLAGMIGRRQNARAGLIAMFLVGFSYVNILYSSEARGYSEVVFFSFVSFYALGKFMENGSCQAALVCSVSSILGFAADPIFLNFYLAALLWTGWSLARSASGRARIAKSLLACHTAPGAFFAAIYLVDLRHMVVGGGSPAGLWETYARSLAWAFGAPPHGFATAPAILTTALFVAAAIGLARHQQSDLLVFFFGAIVAVPLLLTVIHHSDVIYVRYFIIGMSFLLIAFSFILAELFQRSVPWRMACVLLMAGYFVINGSSTVALLKHGRGSYSEAVRFMIQNTKGPEVTFGSDHDFRVRSCCSSTSARQPGRKPWDTFR